MMHVGPRWRGEAAALEHHENPSQPVLGFIRSLAGCGVGEGSPGPAVLCNTLLLVNSAFTAISAQLPPEQSSDSPYSPFPSLLLPLPHVPGSSLVQQQCHCMSPYPACVWYWCCAGEALRERDAGCHYLLVKWGPGVSALVRVDSPGEDLMGLSKSSGR